MAIFLVIVTIVFVYTELIKPELRSESWAKIVKILFGALFLINLYRLIF